MTYRYIFKYIHPEDPFDVITGHFNDLLDEIHNYLSVEGYEYPIDVVKKFPYEISMSLALKPYDYNYMAWKGQKHNFDLRILK